MKSLLRVIGRTTLGELFGFDFLVGFLGGAGALVIAIVAPDRLLATTAVASTIIGVPLAAVIAGVAIQVAFMDQGFLKKLKPLGRKPAEYTGPFLFTVFIGVFALIGIIVLSALTAGDPTWLVAIVGTLTAFLSFWTLASILPAMGTLVQFIELRDAAVDVPEQPDIDQAGRRTRQGQQG